MLRNCSKCNPVLAHNHLLTLDTRQLAFRHLKTFWDLHHFPVVDPEVFEGRGLSRLAPGVPLSTHRLKYAA
jgi:hypothetical protein